MNRGCGRGGFSHGAKVHLWSETASRVTPLEGYDGCDHNFQQRCSGQYACSAVDTAASRNAITQQGSTRRMRTAIVTALGLAVFGSIAALAQTQSEPTGPRVSVVRDAAVD